MANSTGTSLDLCNNKHSSQKHLQSTPLEEQQSENERASFIAKALSLSSTLTSLDFAKLLATNSTLTALDLGQNDLKAKGATSIAQNPLSSL